MGKEKFTIVYEVGENLRSVLDKMLNECRSYSTATSSLKGLEIMMATIKELLKAPIKESSEALVGFYNKEKI